MSLSLGRNEANNIAPIHLDNSNHLLVKDSTSITTLGAKLDTIATNTANIKIDTGDIDLNTDGLEGLQTTANSTLGNIYSRQDDILTASNAIKLSNDTIATKTSSIQSTNHTDLDNIHSRQDDILTSCNATKLTNDTIATKTSALLTANHTDLNNIYTRQDDILTATNAVKTNTQSVENCVSANKLNVNISSGAISGFATESTLSSLLTSSQILSEDFTACDTGAVVISSSALPSGASTSSNQTTINGTLGTINNQFRSQWSNGAGGGTALGPAVALLATESTLGSIDTGVDVLEACCGSNKVNVNISSGGFDGAITNTHLAELGTAINSAKVDVNISSGGFDGAITNTHLAELGTAINSAKVDVNISSGGFDGAITHSALTELASALNSDKLDVNISSGNITGFATSANQSTANGHLLALANVVNPAIATATSTTIPNKLDTIETTANAIETKTTLHTTSELKELLSNSTINSGALSSEFDFENYRHARFFGITTASVGTDFLVMGTNTSGGTYYVMGENLRSETIGSTHYVYSPHIENLPRYIKIINKSGSTNYVFTKLYVQLSEGRVAV